MSPSPSPKPDGRRPPQLACPLDDRHRLLVRTVRAADRLGHEIVVLSGQSEPSAGRLLHSLESASGNWPPSPPLQEIVAESRPQTEVLLGVGRAGRSHWSSAIQYEYGPAGRDQESERRLEDHRLEFQHACRVVEPPEWLGSTYQTGRSCLVEPVSPHRVLLALPSFRLELSAGAGSQIDFDPLTRTLRITAPRDIATLPATVEWRYSIGITG